MPHILIIESNTAALSQALRAMGGLSYGDQFKQALQAIDPGVTVSVAAPYEGDAVASLTGFDAVVFTGSGVDWTTDDARAEPLRALMRRVFAAGLPSFGSCNGVLLAASVLGGQTGASSKGREDGLARDIRLTDAGRDHPMMAGRVDGYAVPCTHRDEVCKLPDGAVILAANAHCAVQAMVCERDGLRFWGVQYHPELDPATLGRGLARRKRVSSEVCADLMRVETDAAAAERLGVRPGEMAVPIRDMELRNWLAQI